MARELNTGRRLRRWNSVNDRAVCCQSEGDGHEIAHFDSGGRLKYISRSEDYVPQSEDMM